MVGKIIAPETVKRFHDELMRDEGRIKYYCEKRGLSLKLIKFFEIGWNHPYQQYTIPIKDENGNYVNIRLYNFNPKEGDSKIKSYASAGTSYGSPIRLYPYDRLARADAKDKTIIICEGEHDALCLIQNGFTAITRTGGAKHWDSKWNMLFKDLNVIIMQDCDAPGREGALMIAEHLKDIAQSLKVVDLGLEDKEDVSDWFLKYKKGPDALKELIKKTDVYDTHEWSDVVGGIYSHNCGKKIKFNAVVAGKDLSPYIVPKTVRARCSVGDRSAKYCEICPLQDVETLPDGPTPFPFIDLVTIDNKRWLQKKISFDTDTETMLLLVNVTSNHLIGAVRKMFGAPTAHVCRNVIVEVADKQDIEVATIIPEINFDKDENKYALRTVYYLGNDIDANRTYQMKGTVVPHPSTQMAVFAISNIKDTKDTISRFVMKDTHKEMLKIMAPDDDSEKAIIRKINDICMDLSDNVTQVRARGNLHLAVLLTYHSVLHFNFQKKRVVKGWLECTVVGDTATGKTQVINDLIKHIRLGEYLSSGENASIRGILGGLQKTPTGNWTITWGRVPLNDRGLCAIDEMENLIKDDILGAMSGVRSSGKASIYKIQQQETTARTRLIWIANPIHGRMKAHDHGVETIAELFKEQQDIRRIDFAVGAMKEEVQGTIINEERKPKGQGVYNGEILHTSVLRAWNIKPDDVRFEAGVEKLILEMAVELGQRYSAEIPLLMDSDGRMKIARMSVALATLLYSTTDGNDVVVKKSHVNVIALYIKALYDTDVLGFKFYSDQRKRAETIGKMNEIGTHIDNLHTIDELMMQKFLGLNDIEDIFELEKFSAKGLISKLKKSNCIYKSGPFVYKKTPAFISWLSRQRDNILNQGEKEGLPF